MTIPPKRLEELRALFKEEGHEISDENLFGVAVWLLARAKAISYEIPVDKKEVWEKICAEEKHPHNLT